MHLVTVFVNEMLVKLFRTAQAHTVCTFHPRTTLDHLLRDAQLSNLCLLHGVLLDLFASNWSLQEVRLWIG